MDIEANNFYDNSPFRLAIENGNIEIIARLIDAGVDVNSQDWLGNTALAETDDPEVARILIEAGADRIDGSVAGLGAGAGNTPLEVFVAVLERMGVDHGVDR